MKAPRDVFGKTLIELARENPDFMVLSSDLATATKTREFSKEFPDRYINTGICEQNMMSFAAGIASEGVPVVASTFAVFAAGRAFDQVRQSVAYDSYDVKIVATHPGLSVGSDGAIHQALEDIALMRAIPHMTVLAPSDEISTARAVAAALKTKGPFYVRVGRAELPKIHPDDLDFRVGSAYIVREGRDITLACHGIMLYRALLLAEALETRGLSSEVIDCSSLKPFDSLTLLYSVRKTGCVMSIEDHSVYGGLGSIIAEILTQNEPLPQKIVGMPDSFGESGTIEQLFEKYGFGLERLQAEAQELVRKKR